jgi:hypothetical protein
MRVVQPLPFQAQIGFQPGSKLGGETDLRWATIGFLVVECSHDTFTMIHYSFLGKMFIRVHLWKKILNHPMMIRRR